jgi:hypothetical protein
MRRTLILSVCVLLAGVTACSSTSSASPAAKVSASAPAADATAIAAQVKAAIPTVTKVVTIDENNDPNHLLGRPAGYVSAAVLYDSGTTCTGIGSDCGATVEVWPTAEAAKARHDMLAAIMKASPILANEYDFLSGSALLRVDGHLKPSVAKAYQAAFGA